MSFGGAVSAMISSIKNNARARSKTYFDRANLSRTRVRNSHPINDKKATPALLANIRNRLKKENQKTTIRNSVILFVLAVLVISIIIFFTK